METELAAARALMTRFAERTGVGGRPGRRYLWTDAFAVCNLLGLARATGEGRYTDLALRLVDDVHHVLGRHRADDSRRGWVSGLGPDEGQAHPTRGGLRIGKLLPERQAGEPVDERREWDRDGQYFHYATKWMHALDQSARAVGQPLFNAWGRELAVAMHRGFTYTPRGGGRRRMYWKVSIDLSRPLVGSMGQHDPLDGFLTCAQLESTGAAMRAPGPSLAEVTNDFAAMIDPAGLATADPLGIGGLLVDTYRGAQLRRRGALAGHDDLLGALLAAASVGISAWVDQGDLRLPAAHRLAFRELGLAIGLAALESLAREPPQEWPAYEAALKPLVAALTRYAALGTDIVSFWLRPENRRMDTWSAHQDINDVMLATALLPEGFLILRTPGA